WDARPTNPQGPLADAARLAPGRFGAGAANTAQAELELHGHWSPRPGLTLAANGLALQQRSPGGGVAGQGRVNELQASIDHAGWAASAGKKVVSWDVGYGFRPNDVVQQEQRRSLLTNTLEGRPLLQLEHFGADSAATLVWVNPQRLNADAADSRGAGESALAARGYWRDGSTDWFAFARAGAHTRGSLGLAIAQVPGEAWEWHASWRLMQRHDGWDQIGSATTPHPWATTTLGGASQWLLGAQWTGEWQQSLMLEWWHDGTALSDTAWAGWTARNAQLRTASLPPAAAAGALAWQAPPLNSPSLRRDNLYLRLAWQPERWTLSADLLLQPRDQGAALGAAVQWQGERWRLNAALRRYVGPSEALLRQLPQRQQGLLAATCAF
ncbi:MAG: hypothetical protein CFE45_11205, partial [Burkholderiales bacterium PBB5]